MRLSTIGLIVTLSIFVAPLNTEAQPPAKVPRIGILSLSSSSDNQHLLDAFRQGLGELGWVEGQNIAIVLRYAEREPDRLDALAAELVRLKVDVILVGSPLSARAAQRATTELPSVMVGVGTPVEQGVVLQICTFPLCVPCC
jgi:putative ABC transport system substrate-binding protein